MVLPTANVSERQYAPPTLAISTVIFSLRNGTADQDEPGLGELWLPLVRRTRPPHIDRWALPGGPIAWDESLEDAAHRNLHETTLLQPRYLEQLYAFGAVERSPDLRVVSIVYWALVQASEAAKATEGDNVRWFAADDLPQLAFDHNQIVEYALWRLRTKMEYSTIAHNFLGETFTLAQLREVYEAVLGRRIDPANFRRQMRSSKDLIATDETVTGGKHRPPRLYRFGNTAAPQSPPLNSPPSAVPLED